MPTETIQSEKSTLSEAERTIVDNMATYYRNHKEAIEQQYFSVKTENGQNRKNDIFVEVDQKTYQSKLLDVSIVLLTANYFESSILNLCLYNKTNQKLLKLKDGLQLFHGSNITEAYILQGREYTILHLHAPETGSHTPCGSADLVRYINTCEFIDPSCIISFGICFGTDFQHYSLGDTIIAEKIYPWSIGIKIGREDWNIKCDDYVIDLRKNAQQLYNRIDAVINETQGLCPGQKARLGHMITSEAVVSNEKVKIEAINRAHTCNIVAGEMEGYGLAKEGIFYSQNSTIACIIMKAICDWGAIKNIDEYIKLEGSAANNSMISCKDKIQAYTVYCAFKTLEVLLDNVVFEKTNSIPVLFDSLLTEHLKDNAIHESVYKKFLETYLEKTPGFLSGKFKNLSIERQNYFVELLGNKLLEEYLEIDVDLHMVVL